MHKRLWQLAVFLLSLLVYYLTLSPHVSFTDAGELAGACYSLGVAHPTGYPLFVMLGYVWSHLPLPWTVIYKLNFFAALCTSLSAVAFFQVCRQCLVIVAAYIDQNTAASADNKKVASKKRQTKMSAAVQHQEIAQQELAETSALESGEQFTLVLSAAMALSYAFAQTVWSQATNIEVYSLHLLLMTTTLWLCIRASVSKRSGDFTWAAIALGLSFTNHLTTILIVLPILSLFFYRPADRINFSRERLINFAKLLAVVIPFSLLYLSLPLNSSHEPWFNWGAVHRGWEQLSYHIFGKQYSVFMFSDEPGAARKQFAVFSSLIPSNTFYIGALLSLVGLFALLRNRLLRPLGLSLLIAMIFGVGYSINYNIHDIDSYFLSSYVSILLLSGIALFVILRKRQNLVWLALLCPGIALATNWTKCDQRDNDLVESYVHMMIDPLPKNAVVLSQQWDYFCSAFWYMQQVEGYRPDVVLVEKELLRRTWYPKQLERWYPWAIQSSHDAIDAYLVDLRDFEHDAETFKADPQKTAQIQKKYMYLLNTFVDNNIDQRPIFATQEVLQSEQGLADKFTKAPFGLCIAICRPENLPALDPSKLETEAFIRTSKKHHTDHLEKDIKFVCSKEILNNASYMRAVNRPLEAAAFAQKALDVDPTNRGAAELLRQVQTESGVAK